MVQESAVQSADRLFGILELLSLKIRGMSLAEICQEMGLPKASASRMLSALMTHGYVVRDADTRKYRLTMRMFQVGSRVADSTGVLRAARPYLDGLAQQTGETVHLVTRQQNEVLYLYKEDGGAGAVRMASFVGLRNPMYCTGVGKSILAFLPDEEMAAVWNSTAVKAFTDRTITELDKMRLEAAVIREQGFALDLEEHEEGVRCIAAPILDANGRPVAAISLSAPANRLDEARIEQLAPLVLKAAKEIAKAY